MRLIAIGSPFNDDSIAWRCLQDLEANCQASLLDFDINYCGSPATDLMPLLHRKTPTLLIDALLDDNNPARVQQLSLSQLADSHSLSSHGFSVPQMLQLADHLNCLPENLWILGISVSAVSMLDEQQLGEVKLQLLQHIQSIVGNH
jgi:hydrogenase maturation protease